MLPIHFALVRRYAPFVKNLFLATEVPDHPICVSVAKTYGVELIPLKARDAGFLKSRSAALKALLGRFAYVLPMQEDFLIDRHANKEAIENAMQILVLSKGGIASARLTPCPGPKGPVFDEFPCWAGITAATDEYGFSFQGTLWSTEACHAWYNAICARLEEEYPFAKTSPDQRRHIEIRVNYAENAEGQRFFWEFFNGRGLHIGWIRAGPWSNAVYMSPWPYRPTAIVQGRLEPWAVELAKREGVPMTV
jgi:hypothetical protein